MQDCHQQAETCEALVRASRQGGETGRRSIMAPPEQGSPLVAGGGGIGSDEELLPKGPDLEIGPT